MDTSTLLQIGSPLGTARRGEEQPSPAFVTARATAEARWGRRLCKFFCGEVRTGSGQYDAILAETERLVAAAIALRAEVARQFGHEL